MSAEVRGSQVVRRVSAILRVVGAHEPGGITTALVADRSALTRPTAHRLLRALAADGLLDQDEDRTHWHLGPEAYLLGTGAASRYDVVDAARESVRLLADRTGESAFFSMRRGEETVCLLREEGSFPVRSFVLSEGVRFPLGVASAGLVILSFESDERIDEYLTRARLEREWGPGHSAEAIRERVAATREAGYAVNPGLVLEGSWGMGAAVFDDRGEPRWALSLTGIEARFRAERQPELGRLLVEQAHLVSQRISPAPSR